MSQYFALQFGAGDPRSFGSMAPTFLSFVNMTTGATLVPPAISEALPGLGVYQFQYSVTTPIAFLADAATTSPGSAARYIAGQLDPSDRIDHYGNSIMAFGSTLFGIGTTLIGYGVSNLALGTSNVALGTTSVALGTSNIALGTTSVAIGTTLLGYGASIYAANTTLVAIGNTLGTLDARIGTTASTFGSSAADPGDLYGYLKRIQEFLEGNATFTKLTGAWAVKSRGGSLIASKTLANSSSTVTKS